MIFTVNVSRYCPQVYYHVKTVAYLSLSVSSIVFHRLDHLCQSHCLHRYYSHAEFSSANHQCRRYSSNGSVSAHSRLFHRLHWRVDCGCYPFPCQYQCGHGGVEFNYQSTERSDRWNGGITRLWTSTGSSSLCRHGIRSVSVVRWKWFLRNRCKSLHLHGVIEQSHFLSLCGLLDRFTMNCTSTILVLIPVRTSLGIRISWHRRRKSTVSGNQWLPTSIGHFDLLDCFYWPISKSSSMRPKKKSSACNKAVDLRATMDRVTRSVRNVMVFSIV